MPRSRVMDRENLPLFCILRVKQHKSISLIDESFMRKWPRNIVLFVSALIVLLPARLFPRAFASFQYRASLAMPQDFVSNAPLDERPFSRPSASAGSEFMSPAEISRVIEPINVIALLCRKHRIAIKDL